MTVYVDLLFFLNFAINYLLLRGSAALSGVRTAFMRLGAAAAIGGVYAVAVVLPGGAVLQGYLWQAACAAAMVILAFGFKRHSVKLGLFFIALSFAFSGAVLLLVQAVEPECVFLGGSAYYALSIPAMLLLAGACYAGAALLLRGCGTYAGGDIVPVTLKLGGRSAEVKALRDTGNTLRDPVSGGSILITEPKTLAELLPDAAITPPQLRDPASAMQTLARQYPQYRFRLVGYQAVGVEQGLLLAVRCCGTFGKKQQSLLAAFSPSGLSCDGSFNALWGGEL